MPVVNIVHQFTFHHADDTLETFVPGSYDLPADIANHPYVLWHSDKRPRVQPKEGTPEYAAAIHRRRARQALLAAHAEELEEAQAENNAVLPQKVDRPRL